MLSIDTSGSISTRIAMDRPNSVKPVEVERVYLDYDKKVVDVSYSDGQTYTLKPKKPVYYDAVELVAKKQRDENTTFAAGDVFGILQEQARKDRRFFTEKERLKYGELGSANTLFRYWKDKFRHGYWTMKDWKGDGVAAEVAENLLKVLFCCAGGSNEIADLHLGAVGYTEILIGSLDSSILSKIIDVSTEYERYVNFVGREQIRQRVDAYIGKNESGYVVIEGVVGGGKTAFIIDLIRNNTEKPMIYHLIRRNMGDWDDPDAFLVSLYAQLLKKYRLPESDAAKHLSSLGKLNVALAKISKWLPPGKKEIIYLDGLNEAFGETGRYRDFWLGSLPQILPKGIYFVVTSRPGRYLDAFFGPHQSVRLRMEDFSPENDRDIRQYLVELGRSLSLDLEPEFIDVAVARAKGNFLFAEWLLKQMKEKLPEERTPDCIPDGLLAMMQTEWERVLLAWGRRDLGESQLLDTAAILVAAFEPLTPAHFEELLSLKEEWEAATEVLGEFFVPLSGSGRRRRRFAFWHDAFRDFLEDEIGPARLKEAHRRLAQGCSRWQKIASIAIRCYALDHWTEHLAAAREWDKFGYVLCTPEYLEDHVCHGSFGHLLDSINHFRRDVGVPEGYREGFGVIYEFLRKRSPLFHEQPRMIGQEVVNELGSLESRCFSKWVPCAPGIERVWLHKLCGPPALDDRGHLRHVACVRFSPDGSHIASGSDDNTVRVWAWDGKCLRRRFVYSQHRGCVNSLAYSRDGSRIASGSDDGTVRILDSLTGKCLAMCKGHEDRVNAVTFSGDGRLVASASSDDTVRIWNTEEGNCIACCVGHTGIVVRASFAPDDRRLVSASWDKTVRVWECDNGKCVATSGVHSGNVIDVRFSSDGRSVISVSLAGELYFWRADTGQPLARPWTDSYTLWNDPFDHDLWCSGFENVPSELWAFDSYREDSISAVMPSMGSIRELIFVPSARTVLTGCVGNVLLCYRIDKRELVELSSKDDPPATCLAGAPDGRHVAVGWSDGRLSIVDIEKGLQVARVGGSGAGSPKGFISSKTARAAAVSRSGDLWVLVDDRLCIYVKKSRQAKPRQLVLREEYSNRSSSVAIARSGDIVAWGHGSKLSLWDATTGNCIREWRAQGFELSLLAFSPDRRMIVSVGTELQVFVWDVNEGRLVCEAENLASLDSPITGLAYARDGETFTICTENGKLMLFCAHTGERRREVQIGSNCLTSVKFRPGADIKEVITADKDGFIWIWKTETGEVRRINGGQGSVGLLALSDDGRWAASVHDNGQVQFWDGDLEKVIGLLFFKGEPLAVEFSFDSRRVFIVDEEGRFFEYELVEP